MWVHYIYLVNLNIIYQYWYSFQLPCMPLRVADSDSRCHLKCHFNIINYSCKFHCQQLWTLFQLIDFGGERIADCRRTACQVESSLRRIVILTGRSRRYYSRHTLAESEAHPMLRVGKSILSSESILSSKSILSILFPSIGWKFGYGFWKKGEKFKKSIPSKSIL